MENRKILTYEDFVNEELSPKSALLTALAAANLAFTSPALGKEPKQDKKEIVGKEDQIGRDLLGKVIKSAPSTKTVKLDKRRSLLCTAFKNIQPEDEKALEKKGWVKVWEDTLPDQEVDSIIPAKQPKEIELILSNDKSFDLGGYELTDDIKDRILCIMDEIDCEGYEISSIDIESSTDKTRLKEMLMKKLTMDNFAPNNYGLSQARSSKIKTFLTSRGIAEKDLKVTLLSEQGKKGGYDPSARYVKLKISLRSPGESQRTIKKTNKGDLISYFQKINETEPQRVPKYRRDCGHNCKVYE